MAIYKFSFFFPLLFHSLCVFRCCERNEGVKWVRVRAARTEWCALVVLLFFFRFYSICSVHILLLLSTFFFFLFPLPIFFISCITFRFLVFLFYIGTLIFHSLQRYGNGNGNATTVYLPIRKTFGVSIFAYIRTDKQCKNSMAENVEIMRNEERMKDPRESQNNTRTHRPKSTRRGTNLIFDYIYLF